MATRRILVIDSDRETVGPLTVRLEQAGYQVEVATDGQAGLRAFSDLKPDLVVLEAMLPKLHGLKVCEEIKKDPDGLATPIVMTTTGGRDSDFMSEAGTIYGYQEYLEKPLSPDRIVAACNRIMGVSENAAPPAAASVAVPAIAGLTTEEVMARLDADVSTAHATVEPQSRSRKGLWIALALLLMVGSTVGFFVLRPAGTSMAAPSSAAVETEEPAPLQATFDSPDAEGAPLYAAAAGPASPDPETAMEPDATLSPTLPQKPVFKKKTFRRKPSIQVDLAGSGIVLDPLAESSIENGADLPIEVPSLVDSLGDSLEIAPPKPQPGTLFELSAVDVRPQLQERIEAGYPPVAQRLGQQGDVILNVLIDHRGAVEEVRLLRGIDRSRLNDTAMTAVRGWRYAPALKDGVPVRVWHQVKFEFRLGR